MARLLQVDGSRLRELRTNGGWETTEELANDVGVSKTTIERAEANGRCYVNTIKRMAAVLRLDDWRQLVPPPEVRAGIIVIELHTGLSKEECQQRFGASGIIRSIEEHTPLLRNEIKKVVILYGSVIVRLLCHSDDAEAFVHALSVGHYDDLDVRGVRFFMEDIKRSCAVLVPRPGVRHFSDSSGVAIMKLQPASDNDFFIMSVTSLFVRRSWVISVFSVVLTSGNMFIHIDDDSITCRLTELAIPAVSLTP